MKALRLFLCAFAVVAAPAFGASIQVDSVGDTFAVDYNGMVDVNGVSTVLPGLTARVDYTVTDWVYDASIDRTLITFDITVENTTNSALFQNATLTGIGFDTSPNVKRIGSTASGDYDYIVFNNRLPTSSGFMVEVCVATTKYQCGGSASGATQIGQTATASVTLAFYSNWQSPIEMSNFGVRYSDVWSSANNVRGLAGLGVGSLAPPIPEPTAAALFGLGALVLGAALRRARQ